MVGPSVYAEPRQHRVSNVARPNEWPARVSAAGARLCVAKAPKRAWTACISCVNEKAVFATGPGLRNALKTMAKCSKADVGGGPYGVFGKVQISYIGMCLSTRARTGAVTLL